MNQQIVVIHGGTTFGTYKDYISYLKNRKINLDKLKAKRDWKNTLEEKLDKIWDATLELQQDVKHKE